MAKSTNSEDIEKIKSGYTEVAKIVGEQKGILEQLKKDFEAHCWTSDAHNPGVLSRKKDGK
jgi:hypothetical protein